ncbi:chitinase [Ensifer sp. 1H6]|uniref:chitinase n=1 Tax=Ensifer sp. 1H6 TaxID=1911585 RepID=UPI0009C847D0|nr:chitinase [Ensifer sp. 1H6]OMQ44970.1 chitinase [Ensifer sp. 1H6]
MSVITAQQIRSAAKGPVNDTNLGSVLVALDRYGDMFGLDKPHRLVHYFAQLGHESADFRFDREIWGPTPAQDRYDTRTDLGNTPARDGDGKKYLGRTATQLTGKDNYRAFREWCRKEGLDCPDFVEDPDAVNRDPWEGLVPIFYWQMRDLNRWADQGDVETITKKINGGKNGFADRIDRFARLALVVLGYRPDNVLQFQSDHRLDVDGDVGPKTRAAMHRALVALVPGEAAKPEVKTAPVTEAVMPPSVEKEVKKKTNLWGWLFGGASATGTAVSALAGAEWPTVVAIGVVGLVAIGAGLMLRHQIIAAVRDIKKAIEDAPA